MSEETKKRRAGREFTDELSEDWKKFLIHFGGKHAAAAKIGVSHSTLNRWTFADGRGHPEWFPTRQRNYIRTLAKEAGLPDPTIPTPPVCAKCKGLGMRTYTAQEREILGLKGREKSTDVFRCECQDEIGG